MQSNKFKSLEGTIVFDKYQIIEKIGTGAFGQIYRAHKVNEPNQEYAVKAEQLPAKHPQLLFEAKLYKYLNSFEQVGVPKVYTAGTKSSHNFMVMQLLGRSLEQIFNSRQKKFSVKTVVMIGLQILQRIEFLHEKGFLHRDIKPDNLLTAPEGESSQTIYLIDFGLSKKYITSQKLHIPYKEGKELTGTARYASINAHKGFEQGRRDDIESIGCLPWQNMKATTAKAKYDLIKNKKITTSLDTLCQGLPSEFESFLSHPRTMKFDQKPNYELLKGLLRNVAVKNGFQIDYVYDWL